MIDMRRRWLWVACIMLAVMSQGCKQKKSSNLHLLLSRELKNFPSASATAYDGKFIYVAGDDAHSILTLNDSLQEVSRIQLFDSTSARIPKDRKADLESSALVPNKRDSILLVLGSGSNDSARNVGWLINTVSKEKREIKLDTFFQLFHGTPVKQTNIEGMTPIQDGILLVNRGNKNNPRNYLVYTSNDFWKNQAHAPLRFMKVGYNLDSALFSGVSGLDYSFKSDRLFLGVSTENTFSNTSDGAIGKSYLWVIHNFSSKRKKHVTAVNPDETYDLGEVSAALQGNKIESVCIYSESDDAVQLIMVSDNDDGTSKIFKLLLSN